MYKMRERKALSMTRRYDQTVEAETDLLDYQTYYLQNRPVYAIFTPRGGAAHFLPGEGSFVDLEYVDAIGIFYL
jgi:hypothetical protein